MELLWSSWLLLPLLISTASSLRFDPGQVGFNLNENVTATDPLDYWGEWHNHTYFPSPKNWRVPFYTLFLDRYVNGDPSNDDANGTQYEHDVMSNQLRHGGDVRGLTDSFDYIEGMGVKAIYIAGMPHINEPWSSDAFSPLDLTLLDRHFGDIDDWRAMISEAHRRGILIVLENTMATMGDLLGFEGYLNTSTPFSPQEHNFVWKGSRQYHDFHPGNTYLEKCDYPRFWGDDGREVTNTTSFLVGCRDSEFDQYGEVASFGSYQEWQRQISKFAFVQDRLREWRSDVRKKIERFSCITIAMLDIDGFRIDKALQVTVDAQGEWSDSIRQCAREHGKDNFYVPGEIVAGNSFGAVYIGRGKEPGMQIDNITQAVSATNKADAKYYIRAPEKAALDGAAFHYTVYRALTRFLGMDGTFGAEGDPPVNFVETWNRLVQTNDMVNANTGEFDPRHMYGISNQDVFRWPAIQDGTQKQILGIFVITLLMPGIPLLTWGEEQAFYVLENQNANYVFGRSPMSSAQAWEIHGCYTVGSVKYANFPLQSATYGCLDENISLDHRDPSHPVRNIIKAMVEMRQNYPVLNDGYYLQQLSNKTYDIYLPGSAGTRTEVGLWSVLRAHYGGIQNFTGTAKGNQNVWLVYQNENCSITYEFDCSNNDALIAPFDEGTTMKNLFPPFEEYTLERSSKQLNIDDSKKWNGCLSKLEMPAWGFKALVPKDSFVLPAPVITKYLPGHDYRMMSTSQPAARVHFEVRFSQEMDCGSVTNSLQIKSSTEDNQTAQLDEGSVQCRKMSGTDPAKWVGAPDDVWAYTADVIDVSDGIHDIIVVNATTKDGNRHTNSVDHFFLRIGAIDNPLVWPKQANYSHTLLSRDPEDGTLYVSHKASGADKWRYSLNWGTSYSEWLDYKGGNDTLTPKVWSGTKDQEWPGEHVIVQYWNRITGSSDHIQHSDLNAPRRRFPHIWLQGQWNQQGFDAGLPNKMQLSEQDNLWHFNFMTEWPTQISLNSWGFNPDGQPDQTQVYGDIDGDFILDRLPLKSLLSNVINVTDVPMSPHLAYHVTLDDATYRYALIPVGSRWSQLALYILLVLIPIATATVSVWVYLKSFAQVKFNPIGISDKKSLIPLALRRKFQHRLEMVSTGHFPIPKKAALTSFKESAAVISTPALPASDNEINALFADAGSSNRRTVLIATMEYDIEDWAIKIKIGGLGVMAQLMGKNLSHQDLIWVVPCVGGVDYPFVKEEVAEPMEITVLSNKYSVQVQYHTLRNITYVLLDAPIFRQQTKAEPYPPRMDDLESAIYYSAWNSCIAEAIRRFPVDLYHINDYHGAIAPLHLLPNTIPCALSLHNAEFQGLWPMRTGVERNEVYEVFNLDSTIVEEYVQFGEVFNLLHAGASYLRKHQKGFGAVGVSKKYGKRSYARYPIFWGLKEIGALPNPDPSDLKEWSKDEVIGEASVDPEFEAGRAALRKQAQEWAHLDQNPKAELFVFVGRWSMQKGVDLIADVFPSILESNSKVQLICVGPVIDLYGSFAALKLEKMMKLYPGRVFSKPEFTALPPYIFSGAEFALIPSRDEPFGLVAVEFGRKGALGVGSRVGGLGQMPGWWFTVESMTTMHLTHQFKTAIVDALASTKEARAMMRARSAKQRFPVAQWVQDLDILQTTAIAKHRKYASQSHGKSLISLSNRPSRATTAANTPTSSRPQTATRSSTEEPPPMPDLFRFGSRRGPGHASQSRNRLKRRSDRHLAANAPVLGAEASSDDNDEYIDPYYFEASDDAASRRKSHRRDRSNRRFSFQDDNIPDESAEAPWPFREAVNSPVYSSHHPGDPAQVPLPFRDAINSSAYPSSPSFLGTPSGSSTLMHWGIPSPTGNEYLLSPSLGTSSKQPSTLSLAEVVGEKHDFHLQKVSPFFTDPNKEYYSAFEKMLDNLNGKNSEDQLCVEDYLAKSEKNWFNRYHDARMGRPRPSTPSPSIFHRRRASSPAPSIFQASISGGDELAQALDQFLLDKDYIPPSGLKRFLDRRIGDWPVYSVFLGFGQVIAANSYQITLLTGEVGETAEKLYIVATIYLISSIAWWSVFRSMKSVYVLSLPFLLYGLAFFLIGAAPYVSSMTGRGWTQNVATGFYAIASSSGSLFFALNFAEEGGAPITSWVYRACVIQGSQQIYVVVLWYWGSELSKLSAAGQSKTSLFNSHPYILTAIGMSIACLMWSIGFILWAGLPSYYRQIPGIVPSFYKALVRRKIITWFYFATIVQNYWLSAPYGRNWLYLWSSQHVPAWQIAILVAFFFIAVWAGLLWIFGILSKRHAWILPIFAIGLGAPRWCQMLWSTSNIGQYVPWAGGPAASTFAGRSLWLWLGVLDAFQGVGTYPYASSTFIPLANTSLIGFGMILLNTLTRFHIAFILLAAQVLGSIATILARATAPNNLGPGDVFPDFSAGFGEGLSKAWFWIALLFQLASNTMCFFFFRKEQLQKP